jgi:hypothetical protein
MAKYILIVAKEQDYVAWKNDEMLCDMNTGRLIDLVDGAALRNKVLKYCQSHDHDRFSPTPHSFNDLDYSEKMQGALTYSEFKELTEHVDKKIESGVVAVVVKCVWV